jgi:erythromycin esterase-like protein
VLETADVRQGQLAAEKNPGQDARGDRPLPRPWSHYAEAVLPEQFDAWVWFDETEAVTPLGPEHHRGMPETYPFGQ